MRGGERSRKAFSHIQRHLGLDVVNRGGPGDRRTGTQNVLDDRMRLVGRYRGDVSHNQSKRHSQDTARRIRFEHFSRDIAHLQPAHNSYKTGGK